MRCSNKTDLKIDVLAKAGIDIKKPTISPTNQKSNRLCNFRVPYAMEAMNQCFLKWPNT